MGGGGRFASPAGGCAPEPDRRRGIACRGRRRFPLRGDEELSQPHHRRTPFPPRNAQRAPGDLCRARARRVGVHRRERFAYAELELQPERVEACHRRDGPARGTADSRPSPHRRCAADPAGGAPGGDQTPPRAFIDHGDYGHLRAPVPSDAEDLAEKLDAVYRQTQTDKIRPNPHSGKFREKRKRPKTQPRQGFSPVGPVGLEPTTNGLKARCSTS